MRRAIATYPAAKIARITATTRNAAGIAVSPVVWYAVGMTPAATVSGATPARTKKSTAGRPSRSLASARDTVPGRDLVSGGWGMAVSCEVSLVGCLDAMGEHGFVHGGLGLGDEFLHAGREPGDGFPHAEAGFGRATWQQPGAEPAGHRQARQRGAVGRCAGGFQRRA